MSNHANPLTVVYPWLQRWGYPSITPIRPGMLDAGMLDAGMLDASIRDSSIRMLDATMIDATIRRFIDSWAYPTAIFFLDFEGNYSGSPA